MNLQFENFKGIRKCMQPVLELKRKRLLQSGRSEPNACDCMTCETQQMQESPSVLFSAGMVGICILLAGLMLIGSCKVVHAETIEGYSINTWAEAIHHAEGNDNYGILTHYKHTTYKQACINTIIHKHRLWVKSGRRDTFLAFLGAKYCPVGADNDNGTNKYWIDNVSYWLNRLERGA